MEYGVRKTSRSEENRGDSRQIRGVRAEGRANRERSVRKRRREPEVRRTATQQQGEQQEAGGTAATSTEDQAEKRKSRAVEGNGVWRS